MEKAKAVYFSHLDSPIGRLLIAATDDGLRYIHFENDGMPKRRKNKDEIWIESAEKTKPYADELRAYFKGELRVFKCKLDLVGTEFQKKCWRALTRIPYGKTCSYADIAREAGSPQAYRAVGQANHNNPIPIIVPCHRVIGSNGTLTGYGGGLSTKEKLLRLEGVEEWGQRTIW
jgi:methylated-DNA-[protein]-cysteine S-methyltransferase